MITVIGSINLDLIATAGRLPNPGETIPGESFVTAPGGKGANQALAARRAGAQVRLIGAVGRDAFAADALRLLDEGGVDLSRVRRTDLPTGTALILVGGDGENMIVVIPGSNGTLTPADLATADLNRGDCLLLQNEVPLEVVGAALESARKAGAVSLYNPAPARPEAAGLLTLADYIVVNESEFDLYAKELDLKGEDREARMREFVARNGKILIVTLGKDGILAATPESFLRIPAMKIEPVDTVGAGDTFCGYLAAGLERSMSLNEALRRAATAGALACLKAGAQPSIPTAAGVDAAS